MKTAFHKFVKASGLVLPVAVLSFVLFSIVLINPAFAEVPGDTDCRAEAVAQGCGKTDETCIQDYCSNRAFNNLSQYFDNRDGKEGNKEDTNEIEKEMENDHYPKCLFKDMYGETFYSYCDDPYWYDL